MTEGGLLWVFLSLLVGTVLSSVAEVNDKTFPLDMANCIRMCQCWLRNGTSMDRLSPSNCLNFCADDHTKPCFDWTKCRVTNDICHLRCGSLSFNCIAMDYPLYESHKTAFLEWLSYVVYVIFAVAIVAAIIIYMVKKSRFR